MLERLLRETDRLWVFVFLAAASSSDELDEDPARSGSSILGASVLFLAEVAAGVAAPAKTAGLAR